MRLSVGGVKYIIPIQKVNVYALYVFGGVGYFEEPQLFKQNERLTVEARFTGAGPAPSLALRGFVVEKAGIEIARPPRSGGVRL